MIRANLHTHTLFCDGWNTPEQLVQRALALGFETLGFSGHSYTAFDQSFCMSKANTGLYKAEIARLKAEYEGKINILCGVEQDYFSDEPLHGYDYSIGSVHYVFKDDAYFSVDKSAQSLLEIVQQHYKGDAYALIVDYFALVGDVARKTGAKIVGHFDLVRKFNDQLKLFDPADPRYKAAAFDAADALIAQGVVFEINTGAMARGLTAEPYPAYSLIDYIHTHGGKLMLSSDCHTEEHLAYDFDTLERYLNAHGYGVLGPFSCVESVC